MLGRYLYALNKVTVTIYSIVCMNFLPRILTKLVDQVNLKTIDMSMETKVIVISYYIISLCMF